MTLSASTGHRPFEQIVTLGKAAGRQIVDPERLEEALQDANIPTLVAVLAHLTDEERWLRAPYAPSRTKGLSDNSTGGLNEGAQAEVRAAALAEVMRWYDTGQPERELDDDDLVRIMSVCMGEPVGEQYAGLMAEEMGLRPRYDKERFSELPQRSEYSVTIVGAGMSGISMGVQLKEAGIAFTILEKNQDLGGTWFENRYPDCGVDTPSYWYSFSYNPTNWPQYYAKRDNVQAYLAVTAEKFGLLEHIRFGVRVEDAKFDEDSGTWHVSGTDSDGSELHVESTFLVSAVGQLNQPKIPKIPGQDSFAHEQFHSARWPADLDLRGRKVAVIGTGASAMQLVPAIAETVESLVVFQRSPQWIAPNTTYSRDVSDATHYLMDHVPYYAAWYRMRQAWIFGDKVYESLVIHPDWRDNATAVNPTNDGHREYFTKYFQRQLEGRPDLIEKALPSYPPFGKRMLLDNGWFDSLKLPHVTLETSGVAGIGTDSVRTADGTEYDVDVIIYATGFDSLNLLGSYEVRGRDGVQLRTQWGHDDARAYLGMTERGFPNMFMLYGPNTNLGHGGSLVFITECHVRYIMNLIAEMIERGAKTIECREDLRDQYNAEIDVAHESLIWTHRGMKTWYRNDSGRVVTNSPWRLIDLWERTKDPEIGEYELDAATR